MRGAGVEVIGPGDMKGHDSHLHLAAHNGVFKLSDQQYNYLFGGNSGGKMATFAVADLPAGGQTVARVEAQPQTKMARSCRQKNVLLTTKT